MRGDSEAGSVFNVAAGSTVLKSPHYHIRYLVALTKEIKLIHLLLGEDTQGSTSDKQILHASLSQLMLHSSSYGEIHIAMHEALQSCH